MMTPLDRSGRQIEDLVLLHLAPLRGYLASLGAHPGLIDDLAQDVFLEAIRNLERYDSAHPFRNWLFGIARNLFRQEIRKNRLEARVRWGPVAHFLVERERSGAVDSRSWEASETPKVLKACMEKLPDRLLRMVTLRFSEGRTAEEIAKEWGMKGSAVRTSLMRARHALQDCLKLNLGEARS